MILYFDNYITNEALYKGIMVGLEDVRKGCGAYKAPDRLDVALYTLSSYANIKWSHVIIKYSLQDESKAQSFEEAVAGIFPQAIFIRGRSDSQAKFQESIELMKKLGDEWIFYAGNIDHPFMANETATLEACLEKACELKKTHRLVSVMYSHFSEWRSAVTPHSLYRDAPHMKGWDVVGENGDCVAAVVKGGCYHAIQIVNIGLLEHWFCSVDLGKMRVIRSEDVYSRVKVDEQAVVVPKKEICSHFDGYSHLARLGFGNPDDIIPPLFIPSGFFERKIRIAYGYDGYRDGWVNINPCAKKYSFRDSKHGTDMKILLSELPLFWKGRISETDINPAMDMAAADEARRKLLALQADPWPGKTPLSRAKKKIRTRMWRLINYTRFFKYPDELATQKDLGGHVQRLAKNTVYAAMMSARKASRSVEASFHLRQMKKKRKLHERAVWLAKTPVYAARAAVNFTKYSLQAPHKFAFAGKEYDCFYHPYNMTWENERCVEVPVAWEAIQSAKGKRVLEVGNVLSHYFDSKHDVLDKYEVDEGVINSDIVGFSPEKKYGLVVSISTLEHVGWDEQPRTPMKIFQAFSSIEEICTPGGRALVTLPIGYNPTVDSLLLEGKPDGWEWRFLKRISESSWKEISAQETRGIAYNTPFLGANCVAFGTFIKK
ncbi:MAG: hypothetical protein WC861_04890 [Candidatus Micrarchaeia archaeon]|jgi:hypothetical protein